MERCRDFLQICYKISVIMDCSGLSEVQLKSLNRLSLVNSYTDTCYKISVFMDCSWLSYVRLTRVPLIPFQPSQFHCLQHELTFSEAIRFESKVLLKYIANQGRRHIQFMCHGPHGLPGVGVDNLATISWSCEHCCDVYEVSS